jgi:hypothetical protein
MAPRRTARASRSRVSYREASFQSDDAHDASYASDANDSDAANAAPAEPAVRTTRQSARRAPRQRNSLREPSSDEDEDGDEDDFIVDDDDSGEGGPQDDAPAESREPPAKRRRTARARPKAARSAKARPARKRKAATSSVRLATREPMIPTDGIRPPWLSLPTEIVQIIFDFAYWGIEDEKKASGWLFDAARTCRTFAKPVLETLYKAPRFSSYRQIHTFAHAVIACYLNRESSYIDYLSKVKRLSLDERMLNRNFNLVQLINILPALVDIDIWSSKDYRVGGPQPETEPYVPYRPEQWELLDKSHRPLRSWHWNGMMGSIGEICKLHHEHPIFHKLRKLTGTHFGFGTKGALPSYLTSVLSPIPPLQGPALGDALRRIFPEDDDESQPPPVLADPTLESLRFEFCGSLIGNFYVPRENLRTLEIHCCDNVDSDGLTACLAVSGAQLHTLVLDHNRSLNLGFLKKLGASCPRLATLSMNLLYFSRPVEEMIPEYDSLMEPSLVPHWPPGLESLSLQHLRRWTMESTVVLFSSIERQPFPRLRRLVLSASIDMPWQTRATFRDQWISRFERTFKRPTPPPPSKHLVSIKAFRLWKAAGAMKDAAAQGDEESADEAHGAAVAPGKRSIRPRRRTAAYSPGALADDSDDDGNVTSLGNRVKYVLGPSTAGATVPGASEPGDESAGLTRAQRQGLCDVVDVRIDNARPRDHEFHESDMLDEEESGDSDYPVE